MSLKKGDFIEIEYTGRIKDGNIIFDTTDEKTAKENKVYNENMKYGPAVICLGEKQLLPGLDNYIIGKEPDKYEVELNPEDAFGKKSAKLLRLIPMKIFRKQNINPFPGLEVNIDGMLGIVRSVSGGRVIVDFNHPLAGRDLVYNIKINKIITDTKKKLSSVLRLELNLQDADIEINDKKAIIHIDLQKELLDQIKTRLLSLIPEIKEIEFIKPEKKKPEEEAGEDKGKQIKKKEIKKEKKPESAVADDVLKELEGNSE
ncbi:peptidylprolyl isomerase [Candidatus Woesearchaeota archaeon]|nr:peptidylprolyl isomerase [Candidatus Woesearchaeota archaeon]